MSTVSLTHSDAFSRLLRRNVAFPLLLCAALCVLFIVVVQNLLTLNSWVDHTDRVISEANEAKNLVLEAETGLRGYLITKNAEYLNSFSLATEALGPRIRELRDMVSDNSLQVGRTQKILDEATAWVDTTQSTLEAVRLGSYRLGLGTNARKVHMDAVREQFRDFIALEEQLRVQRVNRTQEQTRVLLIVTGLLSLVFGGAIALLGRRQLLGLSQTYETALEAQRKLADDLSQQAWLRTGQAELSSKLRGEMSVRDLSAQALAYACQYLGATIGALYVVKESGRLEQTATYAFSAVAGTATDKSPRSFRFGEGLIGQAAESKHLLKLDDLPSNYVRVETGIGYCPPKQLVIVPLLADGMVQAVMELGFVESIAPSRLEFLERSSELLGVGVRSALFRVRLQELLNETQAQAEELQTQQEELRVSNEELFERSRLLQEAQGRMENQQAELEQSNQQLEEQKQSLDEQNMDLTEARKGLEAKTQELEAANRYKSEFLANMSHELRTPLNSTLILAKLLRDNPQGNLTTEQVEFASTIYSAGNDLLVLINDILDLSKVEAGKLDITPENFSIKKLLSALDKTFQPIARDKMLELHFKVSNSGVDTIETDRQRLEQILRNFLSNALKFTRAGSVQLEVTFPSADTAAFSVRDTGEGISPKDQEVIFEAFRQADGTIKRKHGGTGLGLSISRMLATLLGGQITLESAAGRGSTFTLTLPLRYVGARKDSAPSEASGRGTTPERKKSLPKAPTPASDWVKTFNFEDDRKRLDPRRGKTLLVVEDDASFTKVLMDLAHEQGFQCLVAESTAEGFALAVEYLPSAALLDMKLPDALGLSLLDQLKADSRTRHIPVHIISALDYSRQALHLGAIGYALKPADRETLKQTIQKLEEKVSQQVRRVLVIEDDAVQRAAIERLIGEKGVEIVSVGVGSEALKKLKSATFDCMIIDLALPDMSGFDLLDKMSSDDSYAFPPVIVYTGRSLSSEEEERLRRYSRTIIIKGARSPERLLDEVTLFLHQVESKLSPERQNLLRTSRGHEKAFEGRKVLIADDDVRNIFALTSALEQKGAKVRIARNGREALTKLAQEAEIDLVLMDIMMPEMDGLAAIQEIRKQSRFAKLPIIAVTAKAMKDDYDKCLAAGASDYLAKPIDLDRLVSLMRVWLPKQLGQS